MAETETHPVVGPAVWGLPLSLAPLRVSRREHWKFLCCPAEKVSEARKSTVVTEGSDVLDSSRGRLSLAFSLPQSARLPDVDVCDSVRGRFLPRPEPLVIVDS